MLLLGIDIGTSSIKVSVLDAQYPSYCCYLHNTPKTLKRLLLPFIPDGLSNLRKCGGSMFNWPL